MTTKELIESLRACATPSKCGDCPYRECGCMNSMMSEAADAIEDLNRSQEQWIEQERKILLKSQPRWISVKERLPDPTFQREWYLVSLASGCVETLGYEKSRGWHSTGSPVTHWMPLPEPPEKEETK